MFGGDPYYRYVHGKYDSLPTRAHTKKKFFSPRKLGYIRPPVRIVSVPIVLPITTTTQDTLSIPSYFWRPHDLWPSEHSYVNESPSNRDTLCRHFAMSPITDGCDMQHSGLNFWYDDLLRRSLVREYVVLHTTYPFHLTMVRVWTLNTY